VQPAVVVSRGDVGEDFFDLIFHRTNS
jgi:hypothetical protein